MTGDALDEPQYWYNVRTGEVERGPKSLGLDRIGPFATAEEASRALEILTERGRKWTEEDEEEDR